MNQTLRTILVAVIGVLTFSSSGRADSFLTITVNAFAPMTFTSAGNTIVTGTFAIGGVTFANITLNGNQPGTAIAAFATDAKTAITNSSGSTANITIGFASNNFLLPAGSLLQFNSSQSVTVANFAGGPGITQNLIGYGDGGNTLIPGSGTPGSSTSVTVLPTSQTNSGAATSGQTTFSRSGNFGLNGIETFSLANGQTADFQSAINAAPIPEPASVLLLGTGILLLAGQQLRRKS